jgi:hypothetical protein
MRRANSRSQHKSSSCNSLPATTFPQPFRQPFFNHSLTAKRRSLRYLRAACDYATGAINSAVTHLLDEGAGYSRYPSYPPGPFYGAAEVYAPDSRGVEEAANELRRRARIEALKRWGTDGDLLLLTSAARARKLITPKTLAVGSLAALAAAAYPKAAQMWRERSAARDSGVGAM